MKRLLGGLLLMAGNAAAQGPASSWSDAYLGWAPSALATDLTQNAYALNAGGLTKYASTGTKQWSRALRSAGGFALAPSGTTCYVMGMVDSFGVSFGNGVSLPGTATNTLAGYVVSFNAQGIAQWARQLPVVPVASATGTNYAVAVDEPRGKVYSTGEFANTYALQQTTTLGAAGWAVQATGTGELIGRAVAVDPSTGDVYLSGSLRGSVQLGPYALTASATNTDGFVARVTAQGTVAWAYRLGGAAGNDAATHLQTDPAGNAYVGGYFTTSGTFGPGATATLASSGGAQNIFVASYSAQGALRWAERAGGGNAATVKGFNYAGTGPLLVSVAPAAQTYSYGATTVLNAPAGQAQTLLVLQLDPQNGVLQPLIRQQPLAQMPATGTSPDAFPTCVLASATTPAVYLGGSYSGQYTVAGIVLPRLIDLGYASAVLRLGSLASTTTITANKSGLTSSQLNVFPVPATSGHEFRVQSPAQITGVRLVNSLGQIVYGQTWLVSAREVAVPTVGLAPGRYTLQVVGPDAVSTRAVFID